MLEEESQEDLSLSKLRHLCASRFHQRPVQQRKSFMNSPIFRSGHGVRSVIEREDFMVSKNISLRSSQASFKIPGAIQNIKVLTSLRSPHQCVALSLFQTFQQIR